MHLVSMLKTPFVFSIDKTCWIHDETLSYDESIIYNDNTLNHRENIT